MAKMSLARALLGGNVPSWLLLLCDQIIQTQRHCQIPGCECLDICTDRPGSDEHLDPEEMVRCRGCRSDVCEVLEWSSDVSGGLSAGDASCH